MDFRDPFRGPDLVSRACDCRAEQSSKLVTTVVSTFTAYYVHLWPQFFPDMILTAPLPSFDGRAVCYPNLRSLRDYMAWRQVDGKINVQPASEKSFVFKLRCLTHWQTDLRRMFAVRLRS